MSLNELDQSRYTSPIEPDLGSTTKEGGVNIGRTVASRIRRALVAQGTSLSDQSRYLALAAGQAYAEYAVAKGLDIALDNITLVDRQFEPLTLGCLRSEHPETEIIESGLFTYLDHPTRTGFSVVTALGIEYVLEDEVAMKALIKGTPKLLLPGGFVCIFPYFGKDMRRTWVQQGFEEIHGYNGNASLLLYRLSDIAQQGDGNRTQI